MSALLTSPSAFPPRKEFLKNQNTPHQFALLTFNGAEILRLSNFPPNVIATLRTLFQQQLVYRAYREDPEMGVSEFILADRLWNSKSTRTERLVTLIFSAILSHRFKFVTTLAYGRLAQDTRSLVFSKAMPIIPDIGSSSRTNSPAVPASPLPTSSPPTGEGARPEQRTCFALSLTRESLKVICAPKNSTPAILASVRSAWPRGVVSEGRPEEDVYEFQLKGYSLFSTSTFDRDALVHIFGLLRALDSHAFQLVTNLNLSQGIAKSRTKDLWIFDCPADPPSPPHSQHAPSILGGRSPHSSLLGIPGVSKGKEPERVMSVATATTAGMAGLGAGTTNGFYATPEGQAHIRAATAPSPLSRERRVSTDSEAEAVFAAHTRASTSPLPNTLERRPSLLKKYPPGAFVPGEKPKRKNSTGSVNSLGSMRDKSQPVVEPQPVVRPPEDPNPIPPPPPFTPGYSYQSQGTAGPLSESEYAYGYSGVYEARTTKGGAHPDSEYMYKQYVPPPPPPPGTAPGAVIYSTTPASTGNPSPQSSGPRSPGTEEGLLSADAFRETAYSGTSEASRDAPVTWTGTNSAPASPTESQNTHTRHDNHHGQERQQVTPRTAHVPLPQQPEMSMQYPGMEGRPKSEKAFMGIIPPPPPSTYPPPSAVPVPIPPSEERPSAPRMETATSAATVLPPGGYLKTPMDSSVRIVPAERVPAPASPSSTRQRQASQGTVGAKKSSALGRTLSRKSTQDPQAESPSSKGWVLVNVEPTRKASMDAAVAAMDAAAANARVRNRSTSSNPVLTNPGMVTEGTMMESPVETLSRRGVGHVRDNTIDTLDSPVDQPAGTEESAAFSTLTKRKGSLRKKQRSGSSDDSQKKKRFLGLFSMGSKSKNGGHRKMASAPGLFTEEPIGERGEYEVSSPVSDDRLDERDDSLGAVEGVKESTWRRVRDPKAPTPVSKLTIG